MNRSPLLLALLTIFIAGCGKGDFSKRNNAEKAGVFRYAINDAPKSFDPGKVQDVDTIDIVSNVFEGLVGYGVDNRIEPRVAESYSTPDNGKTWIFKIRHGVKFHNGREVTASDISWTFDRNCAKDFASPTASDYLSDIVGVKERISGTSAHISGVSVIDPYTLQIELDGPRPYFIGKLTYPCAFVLCKEAVGVSEINSPAQAIGSGPFKLDSYLPQQQVNLAAFSDYYAGAATVQRIQQPIIKDASTRLMKFKAGDLDQLSLEREDVVGVQKDPALNSELQFLMRPAVYFIGLNENDCPPLQNPHVRRAIAMAIDKDRLTNVLLGGMPEAHGLVSPGVMGYREHYQGLPYNPAGARAELAEAGYPDGKGFPTLELSYRAQAGDAQVCCEAVQQSLRQNLGININMRTLDMGALLDARNKNKLQLYFLSWYADYLDPQNFLSFLLSSDSKLNHDGYKNEEFDKLCKEADSTADESKRLALYNRAEDIAVFDGARIPLYFKKDAILVSPRVTGLRNNLMGQLANTTVKVK